jgi:DNA ligase-1
MEIKISGGNNRRISDKAISDFMNMVKEGRGFGTIDHKDRPVTLSDVAYKVSDVEQHEHGGLSADITTLHTPNGVALKNMLEKYPDSLTFSPVGWFHKETNPETGEEETVIDKITSIDVTFNDTPDTNICLEILYKLHTSLAETSSMKSKLDILKRFKYSISDTAIPYYVNIFNYIYDNDITFGITSEKVDEFSKDTIPVHHYSNFTVLLDSLAARTLTGDTALATTKAFMSMLEEKYGEESARMFRMILDKDFECGVNVKTMSKVFPVKLPFTEYVALSNKYFDREDKVDFENDVWMWSRKLDGNRLVLIKRGDDVKCFSRQGKEVRTLDVLRDTIRKVPGSFVLDGEVCIMDKDGNENFQEIMKVITRKNHTIEHPVMKVFDILTEDEFFGREVSPKFTVRYGKLKDFLSDNPEIAGNFSLVEQTKVGSKDDLMKQFAKSREKGWEGLMIRRDVPYECGRSNNLLKVKGFFDDEYEVVGYEMGEMRFVEEGRQVEKEVLAAVTIRHKGFDVRVGSGFSKEEREYLHDHPEEIVGSTVKVQYFEETRNLQGGISLRFPTVIYFYGKDGRFD